LLLGQLSLLKGYHGHSATLERSKVRSLCTLGHLVKREAHRHSHVLIRRVLGGLGHQGLPGMLLLLKLLQALLLHLLLHLLLESRVIRVWELLVHPQGAKVSANIHIWLICCG